MYHDLSAGNNQSEKTLNCKLKETLKYYQKQNQLKKLNQKSQNLQFSSSKFSTKQSQIRIQFAVNNERYKSRVFVLSNGKMLRYCYKKQKIGLIEQLQGKTVLDLKVLDFQSGREKYLIMTDCEIVVCTILGSQQKRSIAQEGIEQKQNIATQGKPQTIQCTIDSKKIIKQQKTQKQFLSPSQFLSHQHQINKQKPKLSPYRSRKMFITYKKQDRHYEEQSHLEDQNNKQIFLTIVQQAFLVVIFEASYQFNYELMVVNLTCCDTYVVTKVTQQNGIEINKQFQQKDISSGSSSQRLVSQSCNLSLFLFEDEQQSIELWLIDSDLKSMIERKQPISLAELHQVNDIHKLKQHPIMSVDFELEKINQQVSEFGIYFGLQTVTHDFDQKDNIHRIFEFIVKVNRVQMMAQENKPKFECNMSSRFQSEGKIPRQNKQILQNQLCQYKLTCNILKLPNIHTPIIAPDHAYFLPDIIVRNTQNIQQPRPQLSLTLMNYFKVRKQIRLIKQQTEERQKQLQYIGMEIEKIEENNAQFIRMVNISAVIVVNPFDNYNNFNNNVFGTDDRPVIHFIEASLSANLVFDKQKLPFNDFLNYRYIFNNNRKEYASQIKKESLLMNVKVSDEDFMGLMLHEVFAFDAAKKFALVLGCRRHWVKAIDFNNSQQDPCMEIVLLNLGDMSEKGNQFNDNKKSKTKDKNNIKIQRISNSVPIPRYLSDNLLKIELVQGMKQAVSQQSEKFDVIQSSNFCKQGMKYLKLTGSKVNYDQKAISTSSSIIPCWTVNISPKLLLYEQMLRKSQLLAFSLEKDQVGNQQLIEEKENNQSHKDQLSKQQKQKNLFRHAINHHQFINNVLKLLEA